MRDEILQDGVLHFSIETRLLRELGERLVKTREVALLELIKNAFDADANECVVRVTANGLDVIDDGSGITLERFQNTWMRVGTSDKERLASSPRFHRRITGEKGIGRFAVRFIGDSLTVRTVAYDESRDMHTALEASFQWSTLDQISDLMKVDVPYELRRALPDDVPGTTLHIASLRSDPQTIDVRALSSSTLGTVSAFAPLLASNRESLRGDANGPTDDPGFAVRLEGFREIALDEVDIARTVLSAAPLAATLTVRDRDVHLQVLGREGTVWHDIKDRLEVGYLGHARMEFRYFPRRSGALAGLIVRGMDARRWVHAMSGVAVFDRGFRVRPYGMDGDDWLRLSYDHARSARQPRSMLAQKWLEMQTSAERPEKTNYMLKLPSPLHLIGVVQVESGRTDGRSGQSVLVPAADREGFVPNAAFDQLVDLARGAVEAIAHADYETLRTQEEERNRELLDSSRHEARRAIRAIEKNTAIKAADKRRIIAAIRSTVQGAEQLQSRAAENARVLEMMSLMGITAGFMTHEYGEAAAAIEDASTRLLRLSRKHPTLRPDADKINEHLKVVRDFGNFVKTYVEGARAVPHRPYTSRSRVLHVLSLLRRYSDARAIVVQNEVDASLAAPPVPIALYTGLVLNLLTNALKSVARVARDRERKVIVRAWSEKGWHVLQVSDSGVGIPDVLRERVFDPLFTTTDQTPDPLGSGMGLGLAIVRRAVTVHGGRVAVVEPPAGFTTCFEIRLPMEPIE